MKLYKTIVIILLSFSSASAIMAQSAGNANDLYVRPGDASPQAYNNIISLGFGVGGYYPYMGTTSVESPNISLLYENTILNHAGPGNISIGGLLSFKTIYSNYLGYNDNYNYIQRWDYYIIGTRASYHIAPFYNKHIEFYAGAMIAYYITNFKFSSNDPEVSNPGDPGYGLTLDNNSPDFFSLSIYAGIRSSITQHSGVWIEMGYGYTSLAFGVSYKI